MAVLDPVIKPFKKVVLLDYPNCSNVGDSLIWLGQVAYLQRHGLIPEYVCDTVNYNRACVEKVVNDGGAILLQGGGNFGTLWPHIHAFRLKVLEHFPGVPIIQLPQSLHFAKEDDFRVTREAIRHHGNFRLFVRDRKSLGVAESSLECGATLCPDSAFFIGPLRAPSAPIHDIFVLSRTDHEKGDVLNADVLNAIGNPVVEDWLAESGREKIIRKISAYVEKPAGNTKELNGILFRLWNALAQARLRRGTLQLAKGRRVITDRLHTHILCVLLGKPHLIIDNNYGKVALFHEEWTSHLDGVEIARDGGAVSQFVTAPR